MIFFILFYLKLQVNLLNISHKLTYFLNRIVGIPLHQYPTVTAKVNVTVGVGTTASGTGLSFYKSLQIEIKTILVWYF
tara:strand:+ start:854 stop:1087 length:234 start_codon:yes stop_codon:yes gene_type:complete